MTTGIIPGEYVVIEFMDKYPERVMFEGTLKECLAKARKLNTTYAASRTYYVDANIEDEA